VRRPRWRSRRPRLTGRPAVLHHRRLRHRIGALRTTRTRPATRHQPHPFTTTPFSSGLSCDRASQPAPTTTGDRGWQVRFAVSWQDPRLQIVHREHGYGASMKAVAVTLLLAVSLASVARPAGASADVVSAAAPTSWSTGGFAPPPPPPPDWCTPDNPDPACHPPPPHQYRPHPVI
jgi:hypothetical protein